MVSAKTLGVEDLDGNEETPTLAERRDLKTKEHNILRDMIDKIITLSVDKVFVTDLSMQDRDYIKDNIMSVMKFLSGRIKQLRTLCCKNKYIFCLLQNTNRLLH